MPATTPTPRPPANPADRYESADDARAAHAALLGGLAEKPGPADLDRVAEFIRKAAATGAVLDAPEARKQVQGLIDYWAASLLTEYREATKDGAATRVKPATTVLTPFDDKTANSI